MPAKPRSKKLDIPRPHPLHDADVFNTMMERYRGKVLASPEAAREALQRIGIYTKVGKLSKTYR